MIADIGDHSELMGSEWTEQQLLKTGLVLAQGITSKSYLAGMQQFVDLFGGKPGQASRIIAGIMNNQIPLGGLRNELGKLFTPYTRELNSGIADALRNRNLAFEKFPGEDLPIKWDILSPNTPIREWNPITRFFNAISPVHFNLDYSEGRDFLAFRFRSTRDFLNTKIGYYKSAEIANNAFNNNTTLKEEAIKSGYLTSEEYEKFVDPKKMV